MDLEESINTHTKKQERKKQEKKSPKVLTVNKQNTQTREDEASVFKMVPRGGTAIQTVRRPRRWLSTLPLLLVLLHMGKTFFLLNFLKFPNCYTLHLSTTTRIKANRIFLLPVISHSTHRSLLHTISRNRSRRKVTSAPASGWRTRRLAATLWCRSLATGSTHVWARRLIAL